MARRTQLCTVGAAMIAAVFRPEIASAASSSTAAEDAVAGLFFGGMSAFMSFVFCFSYVIVPMVAIVGVVLWILALVDLMQRQDADFPGAIEGRANPNDKTVWLLIVLLAGMVGALIYYVMVMQKCPRRPTGAPVAAPVPAPIPPPPAAPEAVEPQGERPADA